MRTARLLACVAILLSIYETESVAQDVPYLRRGNVEGNVFFGGSYGADSWRGSAGGNLSFAATRNIMPYFEYSYFPGIPRERTSEAGTVRFSIPMSDFHVGVHVRIPLGQKFFVPYLVAGAGGLRTSEARYQALGRNVLGGPPIL